MVGYTPDDPFVKGKRAETAEFDEKFGLKDIGGAVAAHRLYKDREVGTTLKNKAVEWIKAVSYTHLDVYKRQAMWR